VDFGSESALNVDALPPTEYDLNPYAQVPELRMTKPGVAKERKGKDRCYCQSPFSLGGGLRVAVAIAGSPNPGLYINPKTATWLISFWVFCGVRPMGPHLRTCLYPARAWFEGLLPIYLNTCSLSLNFLLAKFLTYWILCPLGPVVASVAQLTNPGLKIEAAELHEAIARALAPNIFEGYCPDRRLLPEFWSRGLCQETLRK